jgi:pyruvate dehydrogenase E2 component (dihydrolipoamide acetyltransferase)
VTEGRVASSGYAQTVAKELGVDLQAVQPTRGDQYITSKDVVASASSGGASRKHIPAPGVINASPVARKLASENNLDVRQIIGTGNFGRVLPDDVLRAAGKLPPVAAPAPAAAPAVVTSKAPAAVPTATSSVATTASGRVALTGMQKAVAKNMEKSLSVPVFRVSRDIVTDNFDALYAKLKSKGVSVSALLAKAVAEVCKKHPIMNAAFDAPKSEIVYNDNVNVAMAVAIDGGLITPTIMKAQDMDLFAISRTWKDLVDRAKSKKLSPAEYSSGKFAVCIFFVTVGHSLNGAICCLRRNHHDL